MHLPPPAGEVACRVSDMTERGEIRLKKIKQKGENTKEGLDTGGGML